MMRSLYKLPFWFRSLFRKGRVEQELRDELHFHLEKLIDNRVAKGMPPEEARYAALRELGSVEQIKEECRDMRPVNLMQTTLHDLRYGLRMMAKAPGFTVVSVLTLALGIGANTAIFSLVDTILLRPLPYRRPEQLVVVSETVPLMGGDAEVGMAAGEYLDYRNRNRSFIETAAYESEGFNLTGAGDPVRVNAAGVSASLFPLLGVAPRLGRTFTAEEERPGNTPAVVLAYPFWQNHFGADEKILGKTLKLDEKLYVVVGVMPTSFQFPFDGSPLSERADIWVPETFPPDRIQDRLREFGVGFIGRLRPEAGLARAQADMTSIADAFMQEYHYSGTIRVVPHVHRFAAYAVQKARPLVMLLAAAVACVLLIACANVANLLLARGTHRSHEMAIRSAVGAARTRLLRQCLVESLLLSLAGAGAGLVLAVSLVEGVRRFGPADVPRLQDVTLNPSALLFTVVLSLVTTLLFGFVPAWRLSHTSPQDCLNESARAGVAHATHRLQSLVAVAEIAMALLLLVGGGLLLRSFVRVLNVPLGFGPEGAFVVRTLFDETRYPDPVKRGAVQKELIDRLSSIQGVEAVAAATHLPLSDTRQIGFRLEHAAEDDFHWAENSRVSPGYFRAMGIPILRGREFTAQDSGDSPRVAVISETMARRYFPGNDPLGQRFYWGGALFTIVGLVGDVHISALDADPPPMVYHSMFQVQTRASARTALVLRLDAARQHDASLASLIREQVWSLDRALPIYGFSTLGALISGSLAQRRFTTLLILSFAATALALALVGLFGVMSYLVAQRRRELAIRMALGADRVGVCWMVVKRGIRLAVVGCVIGLALLPLARGLVRAALFQTSAYDPTTLLVVPALLVAIALGASYLPARRAAKVDPMVALRHE